jgi:branched-chain amino acid transport system permease protein
VAGFGRLRELLPSYLGLAVTAVVMLLGASAGVEMVYHLQLHNTDGSTLRYLGMVLDARSVSSWAGAALVLAVGLGLFEWVRRGFAHKWGAVQTCIEAETKRREAVQ